jgi:hypothetical protein
MPPQQHIRPKAPARKPPPTRTGKAGAVRRSFYIHQNNNNNTAWLFALLILLVLGGGTFAYFFQNNSPSGEQVIAQEDTPSFVPATQLENVKLKPIIEQPESDGERPPENSLLSEDKDSDFEPHDVAPAPPPPPPKAEPKKLPKPKLIKKTIVNKVVPDPNAPTAPTSRTVDILIVYSKEAKARLGGPEGVLTRANAVVAYTNFRFNEKKSRGTLRLVGLVETDYSPPTEGDTVKISLDALRSGGVTCAKENVHKLRNKVGADLVCIWSNANRGGGGGLAQIHGAWSAMNFPSTAIFRHEMAHNFGWSHSDRNDYSMIEKNIPGMAKWNKTKILKDRLYVQYWTDYEESEKK